MLSRASRPFASEPLAPMPQHGQSDAIGEAAIHGTPGNDRITGTQYEDYAYLDDGGNDHVSLLGDDDYAYFFGAYTSKDFVDGGSGYDHVTLEGDYEVKFRRDAFVDVEQLDLIGGTFRVTGHIGWGDQTFYVQAYWGEHEPILHMDASANSDVWISGITLDDVLKVRSTGTHLDLIGQDGDDQLVGGVFGAEEQGKVVRFWGGAGADRIKILEGSISNTVYYDGTEESPRKGRSDVISGWISGSSRIELDFDSNVKRPGVQSDFHFGDTAERVGDISIHFEDARDRTVVEVFTDHDDRPDLIVFLRGHVDLSIADFTF